MAAPSPRASRDTNCVRACILIFYISQDINRYSTSFLTAFIKNVNLIDRNIHSFDPIFKVYFDHAAYKLVTELIKLPDFSKIDIFK